MAKAKEQNEERYLVIDGRRWRRSDPAIPASLNQQLVNELMAARRAVKSAKQGEDDHALRQARNRVHDAKVALGERGREWWLPRQDEAVRERIQAAVRALLRFRDGKTICPSEVARIAGGDTWRELMPLVREQAQQQVEEDWLEITQRGEVVRPPFKGAIRLRKRR